MTTPPRTTDPLPTLVRDLIADRRLDVRSQQRVTTLVSDRSDRASWRLDLADGRVLKARLVHSAAQAARLHDLSALVAHLPFSRVLAHRERALLEDWLPGQPLGARSAEAAIAEQAGAILGRLHEIEVDRQDILNAPSIARRLRQLEVRVARLVDGGALESGRARAALEHARALAPEQLALGLIHQDFCAENLVEVDGDLWVVDNESFQIGPFDCDLARTWYRWSDLDRTAFLRGYEHFRQAHSFRDHREYWRIETALRAAAFRLEIGMPTEEILAHGLATLR